MFQPFQDEATTSWGENAIPKYNYINKNFKMILIRDSDSSAPKGSCKCETLHSNCP